jgi:hypothetical protein
MRYKNIATIPWVDPPQGLSEREYRRSTALAYEFKIALSVFSAILKRHRAIVPQRKLKTSSNVISAYMHGPKVSPTSSPQTGPQKRCDTVGGFLNKGGPRRVQKQKTEKRLGAGNAWQWSLASVDLE